MAKYEIVPYEREKYEHLSDFVVKTDSKAIKCHKFKLSWNSEVFDKMFQCSDYNENQKGEIVIEDYDDDTVEDFVKFMYNGKLEDETRYTTELLSMAHKYQVEAMMNTCSNYIAANVTKENVAQVWLVSEACEIPTLIKAVHVFLADNWNSKKECDGIVDVIKNHPEYMLELFSHVIHKEAEESRKCRQQLEEEKAALNSKISELTTETSRLENERHTLHSVLLEI